MWFKNASIYRLPDGAPDAAELAEQLDEVPFAPCLGLDWFSEGFAAVAPFDDALVFAADGSLRFALKREEKVLPAGVIRDKLAEMVASIQAVESRNVGRKEKTELKEAITAEMLPRAFTRSSRTEALMSGKRGYLLVDTAAATKAEGLLTRLRAAMGGINTRRPATQQSAGSLMTDWLEQGEADGSFELGFAATLQGAGDVGAVIKINRKDLTDADVAAHIKGGMSVTELELVWRESVCFTLTRDFAIKRIQWLDVVQEQAEGDGDDARTLMAASQMIMAHLLAEIIDELAELLGGWSD